jgi:RNA polymerase sigma factor (sigma-70 family)
MGPVMAEPVVAGKAFEAFYRRTWRDAARWATALTGDRHVGEELAQEAFLRVAAQFGELDSPEAYLRTVVVNLARSAMRSSGRRVARERRSAMIDAAATHGGDAELLASLDTLSYEQRAVLVLRYWADWDEVAIAAALGCRPSTVRSHARRALVLLREEIQP